MKEATADPAKELTLYFRINKDNQLVFYFLDANGNALDLSAYSIVVNFKVRKNDIDNFLQLIPTINSNSATLTLTKSQANAFREQTYYWEMVRTKTALEKVWLTGDAVFHLGKFDGVDTSTTTLTVNDSELISVQVYDNSLPILSIGTYSTVLNFNIDQDIYHDATGAIITFTLGITNVNGICIFLRLNKPNAVTFPNNFEALPNSSSVDSSKLNVFVLVYYSNWNGLGTAKVIYSNNL